MTNRPKRSWRKRWPDEAAAFVRETRQKMDLTQEQMAKLLDSRSSARTVQQWEAGLRVPPEYLRQHLLTLLGQRVSK